jgi:RNA polymerase sigma factor (sigma-70 family)
MRHSIEFKHFEPKQRVQELIENLIARLEKQAKDFPQDLVFLRLLVEEMAARKLYHVAITLELPGRTLATKEERHDVNDTIRDAFAEIERQLEKYKASLRGEHLWKRPARRAQARREKKIEPVPAQERRRELLTGLIDQHLKKLHNFVRREIAYYQANGDLLPGELTASDVVDAVVLRAYDEFVKAQTNLDLDRWLIKLAIEYLESEVTRLSAEREKLVHVEEDIPETPPAEEVSTLGEEIFDFYQPDEDLKLEDVVPDIYVPTPEEMAESRELQRCVNRTLASLPKVWRRAFMLHYIEGLSVAEVSHITEMTEDQVRRYLEYAREYLRQKLIESGLRFRKSGSDQEKLHSELPAGDLSAGDSS